MIKRITIHGLRGFGEERTIEFAIPANNTPGSGLTILVGANNSGKTTVLEALRSFNAQKGNSPSYSERKRNMNCENGRIHLKLETTEDEVFRIDTIEGGGSTTSLSKEGIVDDSWWESPKIFVLQSRRFVDYEFHRSE